ncbi:MAG: 4-(cytidine 5'-diphospho)-2-C-methyl-D-erythritol kinase [Chloroflexi bacterium]|nr:4-(cytidine 5'-diphospho)-2-C-methyl-D-erythritol kinase [Chloroflexota bacterium]
MARVRYCCYAKINLTLEVLRPRDDGYHELASLVHTVSLFDDLLIESAPELLTNIEGLPIDGATNLVASAAQLLLTTTHSELGARLRLTKCIPVAAGLGGGSSDAAATLVGLNRLWGTGLGADPLARLAAELGSDVPFFIRGGAALMRGRGEDLQIVPAVRDQWLVIVVPPHDVVDKTKRLYGALDPTDFSSGEVSALAAERLRQHQPLIEDHLVNAFARAARAIFPGLADLWTAVEAICQRRFFLSGAGPALFALAADRADAHRQQGRLAGLGLVVRPARTVKHARAAIRFARDSAFGYP